MPTGKIDRGAGEVDAVDEAEEGIDFARIKMIVGFFLRAPRRRPALAMIVPAIGIALTFALAAWLPRLYTSDMRIIAHRSGVLQDHDGSQQPEPTAGVSDEIMKRDNLNALIKDLDLVRTWDSTRPPALRLKDWVATGFRGPLREEEKVRAIVGVLEKNLSVSVEQTAITLTVDWPNPQLAHDIVDTVYKNFLDAREDSEVRLYSERLRVLEMRAQLTAQDVDSAIAELSKREEERRRMMAGQTSVAVATTPVAAPEAPAGGGPPPPQGTPPNAPKPAADVQASDEAAHQLEEVRTQIRVLEEEHRRRLAEVETQLADAQGTYGPLHPTVLALKRKLEIAREPSGPLDTLRATEKDLVAKLAADVPAPASSSGVTSAAIVFRGALPSPTTPGVPPELREMLLNRDDPPTAYARSKLQATSQQYNDVLSRMQMAKIELDVARQNFKDTYTVVRPAEIPVKPHKPNVAVILIAGLMFSLLLAFLAPGARDLLTGRILEPWQVETVLKIPVLGALPQGDSFRPPAQDTGPTS